MSKKKKSVRSGKKPEQVSRKPEKRKHDEFFFFVPDQGEGMAKGVVIALKVLMLVVTTICCVVFGIFGPVVIWNSGSFIESVADNPGVVSWLISSCVYIVGTFVIMLGHSKIAAVIDIIAMAGSLVTYYLFVTYAANPDITVGPTQLYMPSISLTVMAVVIAMLINIPKWLDKQAVKAREKAPSILLDDDDDDK